MNQAARLTSTVAFFIGALAPVVHGQGRVVAPPSPTGTAAPSHAPAPEPSPTPSPAERLVDLRQEQQSLAAEVEELRSVAGQQGAGSVRRLAEILSRLDEIEEEMSRLRREVALSTPPALTGPRGPADPPGMGAFQVAGDTGQVSSGTAFNPQISVILDGVYFADDRDGASFDIASNADGFHVQGAEDGHSHGGVDRGFSLREAELTFSGSVDPYFDLWAIFAIADGEIEVEEGYVQTRKFIPGFQLRFGRFYSGIGYINRQHPHQWDFVDQNLPYHAILGGGLNETGVQLTWLPNLPFYTQIGVEAVQGDNEGISNRLADGDETPWFSSKAGPRLFTGFLKLSPDVGYSHTLQVGASYAHSRQHQELHDENEDGIVDEALQGHSDIFGLDAVWKYDSPRQYGKNDLTVQAEYLYRRRSLDVVAEAGEPVAGPEVTASQDGLYVQAVYGLFSRWTVGARFDVVGLTNRASGGGEAARFGSSHRYTADLTFNPTEFSRLRAQLAHGDFEVGGTRESFNQLYLQFQMSLGAHGAHKF